ncbi:hypothetical protein F5887DRAFT_653447 [Amanita rubescens]|nr:hypothetical protein F5887DRAFT_653447 [Amanita rubescens]
MWNILQAIWTAFIGLFTTKRSSMPDSENQFQATRISYSDSRSEVFKVGKGPAPRTALTGADINIGDKVGVNQKTAKSRTRSAKYLLRQGAYIENWNSPGCELSELYGHKSPRLLSPSPHLSGFLVDPLLSTRQEARGDQAFRFPGKSPTLPADLPCTTSSSRIIRSLDLDNLKSSPVLADFSQLVMKDLQPVGYCSNPSSAVSAYTFWDLPVNVVPLRPSPRAISTVGNTILASASGGSQQGADALRNETGRQSW